MTQKIKAPNSKGGSGFAWGIVAVLVIAAVVIGVVVWQKQGAQVDNATLPQQDVNFTVTAKDNVVTLKADNADKDAPKVDLWEDFSCPHCADLHKADKQDVLKALNEGKLVLNYHFLNFLDGASKASTRGVATAYTVAETGNAKAFWNLHSFMLDEQNKVARQWEYEDMGKAASKYDLPKDVVASISNGSVEKKGEEVAKAAAAQLEKRGQKVSSPIVYINDKEYSIQADPTGQPKSWVPDALKK